VLIFDGFPLPGVVGPMGVFERPMGVMSPTPCRLTLYAPQGGDGAGEAAANQIPEMDQGHSELSKNND